MAEHGMLYHYGRKEGVEMDGNTNAVVTVDAAAETKMADATVARPENIPDFTGLALFLAQSYGQMLRDREYLKKVIDAGVPQYTKEMAIRELSSVSVNYESERVQTSNISRIPERITELLDNGYVEKMNRRLQREKEETVQDHAYLCWKIEVVETAMRERMDEMEQAVFTRIFVRGYTFAQVKKAYRKRLHNAQICKYKAAALRAIADEIALVSRSKMTPTGYTDKLKREAAEVAEVADKAKVADKAEEG